MGNGECPLTDELYGMVSLPLGELSSHPGFLGTPFHRIVQWFLLIILWDRVNEAGMKTDITLCCKFIDTIPCNYL